MYDLIIWFNGTNKPIRSVSGPFFYVYAKLRGWLRTCLGRRGREGKPQNSGDLTTNEIIFQSPQYNDISWWTFGFLFLVFFYVFKVHVRIHHDRSPDDGVGIVIFTWYHFYFITSNSEFYGQISYILTGGCRKYSYEMI